MARLGLFVHDHGEVPPDYGSEDRNPMPLFSAMKGNECWRVHPSYEGGARRHVNDVHRFDQPLPSVLPALDLDGFEDPFDARVFPALDREDFDGLAIGIPPFRIEPQRSGGCEGRACL